MMNKKYRKWKILTGYAIGLRKKYGLPYKHLFRYAKWYKSIIIGHILIELK